MALWLVLALMTAIAVVAVLWPLGRSRSPAASPNDLAVYRDQLEEIDRDQAEGAIGAAEAEAARVEVSRRLIAAADMVAAAERVGRDSVSGSRFRRLTAAAVLVALPLGAIGFYVALGSPDLPGQPLVERTSASRGDPSIAELVARVEAHLEANPNDGRGWEVVAPVYMRLDRYEDAVKARRNAIRLLGATAERESGLGEALAALANGVVTAEAKAAFERAASLDVKDVKSRFYLGLAAEQDGKSAEAARIWRDMIEQAPEGSPWIGFVRQALARVDDTAAPARRGSSDANAARGPSADDMAAAAEMSPDERNQMVRGMVERLAGRLREDGSDVEGWLRLVRAYIVLGDPDNAKRAATDARRALADHPDKLRYLNDGVKGLGFEG